MDVSVFIANKRRFWTWIMAPLLVRFALVSIVFGATARPLARCEEEKASAKLIEGLKKECDASRKVLTRYEVDPSFPVNEQLYQIVAEKNSEYGLTLEAEIEVESKDKKVHIYRLDVGGGVPSVYVVSSFLVDMLEDPLLTLQECAYGGEERRKKRRGEEESDAPSIQLSCKFEKLALMQASTANEEESK